MKLFIILIISTLFSFNIKAQSGIVTSTLSVKGNCGECKDRIENAADIKGVKNSAWDLTKQTITVTYDSKKVTLEQIEKSIAKSGHKTSNQKQDSAAYNALPECCKYDNHKHTK